MTPHLHSALHQRAAVSDLDAPASLHSAALLCTRANSALAECGGMASANAAGVPPPVKDGFPQIQNEDGSISEVLAISKHLVGKLIGKGGTTIQQLQATTSTSIQIDQVRDLFLQTS
jgi:hypothetical protein